MLRRDVIYGSKDGIPKKQRCQGESFQAEPRDVILQHYPSDAFHIINTMTYSLVHLGVSSPKLACLSDLLCR